MLIRSQDNTTLIKFEGDTHLHINDFTKITVCNGVV